MMTRRAIDDEASFVRGLPVGEWPTTALTLGASENDEGLSAQRIDIRPNLRKLRPKGSKVDRVRDEVLNG